jgi:2-succinyl-6-hydroxy-2,4-cyclohexadiene-1-carboxylate synthase
VTTLLLLHGFTGTPGSWDATRELLPAGVTTICPWLVGHGRPEAAPEIESFEGEVDRLVGLVQAPVCVAGYSLGARLALGVLVRHPGRVRAAVLVSGSAGLETAEERAQRRRADRRWIDLLESDGLEAFVACWEAQPLFATQSALPVELRRAERERRLAHTAAGLSRSLVVTGSGAMPSYRSALSGLTQPVEIVTGELDSRFCALGRALAGELPRASLHQAQAAGHNLLLERPRAVADAILRGLEA